MRWMRKLDLEQWAPSMNARNTLARLIQDLVRASVSDIHAFRFPADNKSQAPGYDGIVEVNLDSTSIPNVPNGRSIWEIGTNEDPKNKGNKDFKKRTDDTSLEIQKQTTFVFLTPRTWQHKQKIEDWEDEKKGEGSWKDVKCIDGVQLVHWLDSCPAVAARYARYELGIAPKTGAQSVQEFWDEYRSKTEPALTEEVLLCDRQEQADELVRRLQAGPNKILLRADSPHEVVAFAVAAIRKAEDEIRKFLEAKTLIVTTESAVQFFADKKDLVYLCGGGIAEKAGILGTHSPTLYPIGRDTPKRNIETLVRPSSPSLGKALTTMGFSEEDAYQTARKCGRSVTVLARVNPGATPTKPDWIDSGVDLLPALLAGAWDSANAEDTSLIAKLARTEDYLSYERNLRPLIRIADPPLDVEGSVWKLRAPVDAFVHLGNDLGSEHLDLLSDAAIELFSTIAPRPSPDDVFQRRSSSVHSQWLRDGLATTLLQLSILSDAAELNCFGKESAQDWVNRLVGKLPGISSDPRWYASHRRQIPLLMEAAPVPFLTGLERMLDASKGGISELLTERETLIFPEGLHTGLLWGLETLGWSSEYFHRVCMILARLAEVDPGGRLGNRPISSLRGLLLSWHPDTNASLARRMAALDAIVQKSPSIAWDLLVHLLPRGHDTASPGAKPRLRDMGTPEDERLTYGLVWESQRHIVRHALSSAANDEDRYVKLLDHIENMEPVLRHECLCAIDAYMGTCGEDESVGLWGALREISAERLSEDSMYKALSEEEADLLNSIVDKYRPKGPLSSVKWLFNDWTPRLPDGGDRFDRTSLEKARQSSIVDVINGAGVDGVLRLASSVKLPHIVGHTFAQTTEDCDLLLEGVALSENYSEVQKDVVRAVTNVAGMRFGEAWLSRLEEAIRSNAWSNTFIVDLVVPLPDLRATWEFVESLGEEIEKEYWRQKIALAPVGTPDKEDIKYSIERYLRFGRSGGAIHAFYRRLEQIPGSVILEMLDAVLRDLVDDPRPREADLPHCIARVFEHLTERSEVSREEVAKREYAFLPFIEKRRKPLVLHELMADSPDFYMEVICDVFRPASGVEEPVPEEQRQRAVTGYRLLNSFKSPPGITEDEVNTDRLKEWVAAVRRLGAEKDRSEITDLQIGHLLAHAPPDADDGAWPHKAMRQLLETTESDQVERGIRTERFNMRGVVTKGVYEGGAQERELASLYRKWAESVVSWPRTEALLKSIARDWDRHAEEEDTRAQQEMMRH